jgi:hypothetical protein
MIEEVLVQVLVFPAREVLGWQAEAGVASEQ